MKRIVICGDGTWNERDRLDKKTGTRRPTNVTKTGRAVLPRDARGISQVTYYHLGVGTGGPLDQLTGGAFGDGMEANIQDMYRFIVYNYEPGDELYLFGFSRGAFTVRSLAGFLSFAGLVTKDEDYYVPDLYACYSNEQGPGTPQWNHLFVDPITREGPKKGQTRLVDRRAQCPPIRFIGVWDTVGALGAPGLIGRVVNFVDPRRHGYHEVGLSPQIENVAHALAIDEHRRPFAPTLYARGPWKGTLHQAWFTGVHSDVGGGYDYDDFANHALHWVLSYASALGLALDEDYLKPFASRPDLDPEGNPSIVPHDSMSPMYRLLPPLVRPIGALTDGEETVHESALVRWKTIKTYRPENLDRWLASHNDV